MSFCFIFKPCKQEMPNALKVLVNALPTTLQISSRASTYRSCFEHFPFFTRSFSQHNTQRPKASACQKPLFFLVCNVISIKVCKELGRGSSPFAAQHFVVCGLREAFIRKSVTKNFFLSPIKFCASLWIRSWNTEYSPCKALTGWSMWHF